jgi:hypothetical protein
MTHLKIVTVWQIDQMGAGLSIQVVVLCALSVMSVTKTQREKWFYSSTTHTLICSARPRPFANLLEFFHISMTPVVWLQMDSPMSLSASLSSHVSLCALCRSVHVSLCALFNCVYVSLCVLCRFVHIIDFVLFVFVFICFALCRCVHMFCFVFCAVVVTCFTFCCVPLWSHVLLFALCRCVHMFCFVLFVVVFTFFALSSLPPIMERPKPVNTWLHIPKPMRLVCQANQTL